MVLGVDWMKGVSPISFDFNRTEVSFNKGGRKMPRTRERESGSCKMISRTKLHKMLKNKWCQLCQLFSLVVVGEGSLLVMEGEPKKELRGEVHLTVTSQSRKLD